MKLACFSPYAAFCSFNFFDHARQQVSNQVISWLQQKQTVDQYAAWRKLAENAFSTCLTATDVNPANWTAPIIVGVPCRLEVKNHRHYGKAFYYGQFDDGFSQAQVTSLNSLTDVLLEGWGLPSDSPLIGQTAPKIVYSNECWNNTVNHPPPIGDILKQRWLTDDRPIGCKRLIEDLFPQLLNIVFLDLMPDYPRRLGTTLALVEAIRHSVPADFMTETLKSMRFNVGIPPALSLSEGSFGDEFLKSRYGDPHLLLNKTGSLNQFIESVAIGHLKFLIRKVEENNLEDEAGIAPTEVNAMYSKETNQIWIPPALMIAPFYSSNSSIETSARLGALVAHEIAHGIEVGLAAEPSCIKAFPRRIRHEVFADIVGYEMALTASGTDKVAEFFSAFASVRFLQIYGCRCGVRNIVICLSNSKSTIYGSQVVCLNMIPIRLTWLGRLWSSHTRRGPWKLWVVRSSYPTLTTPQTAVGTTNVESCVLDNTIRTW